MVPRAASLWLLRIAVAIAISTIACFGYYSLAYIDQEQSAWTLPVVLAYPIALAGLIGIAAALMSERRANLLLWLALLCFLVPAVFLLMLRV